MNAVETLKAAKAKIIDPAHWTTGVFARDAKGRSVASWSQNAVRWCALGAVNCVSSTVDRKTHLKASNCLREASLELYNLTVPSANDHFSHSAIIRMFDLAIKTAQEESK